MRIGKRWLVLFSIVTALLSCSRSKEIRFETPPITPPPLQSSQMDTDNLQAFLFETDAIHHPKEVDSELFEYVRTELKALLKERFSTSSADDTEKRGNGVLLVATPDALEWEESRARDWNNDGTVRADDILPIAIHLGKSDDPASPKYWKYAKYIDGDGNHLVGIGDVLALADHFGESTIGYNIYEALDSQGKGRTKVGEMLRATPPSDPENPPSNLSFATLQYSTLTGRLQPSGWVPSEGKWYQVAAFDANSPPQENAATASNWVEFTGESAGNQLPVALAAADPISGNAPLTVNFTAAGSYDPDGWIVLYEWDFNDDGIFDHADEIGETSEYFPAYGSYTIRLRVTDNEGAHAETTLNLRVNAIPVATAGADIHRGPAPLTVHLTASAYDPDGTIVLYKWDFTNDGIWDWVNNQTGDAEHTYEAVGEYAARLEVTDDFGASYSEGTFITVTLEGFRAEVVDVETNPSYPVSLGFGRNGSPAISYCGLDNELKVARRVDDIWEIQTVASSGDAGKYSSLAFNTLGHPSVAFYNSGNKQLQFAAFNGSTWNVITVDAEGDVGMRPSLSYSPDGQPTISYYDVTRGDLKFARLEGSGSEWQKQVVDGLGDVGEFSSLAYDRTGDPSIAYYDSALQQLKFARLSNGNWDINVLESGSEAGRWPSLAYDSKGNPSVAYRRYGSVNLATWNGFFWDILMVHQGFFGGGFVSLAYDPLGQPSLFYFWSTGPTLVRWNGTYWQWVDLSGISAVAKEGAALAFDSFGNPALAYGGVASLKFARWISAH